jgi:serine/threonine protein kinase
MIGTPLYMSPEQAEMSVLDIDTRSDIYSLAWIPTAPFAPKSVAAARPVFPRFFTD